LKKAGLDAFEQELKNNGIYSTRVFLTLTKDSLPNLGLSPEAAQELDNFFSGKSNSQKMLQSSSESNLDALESDISLSANNNSSTLISSQSFEIEHSKETPIIFLENDTPLEEEKQNSVDKKTKRGLKKEKSKSAMSLILFYFILLYFFF